MSIVIHAEKRNVFGKNASRRLRKESQVPAILYGESIENVALVLNRKDIFQILRSGTRENTIFRVAFDGEERDVMFKDLQVDPTTDQVLHADLIQIAMDKMIRVPIPIVHSGEPVGVKTEGGFIDFVTREVEVECLPRDIPDHIAVDIAELHIHQSLKAEHIVPPPGVRILTDPSTVLILISMPHKEEVFPGEKAEEAVVEEKEPEVIKKERAEKEGEEEK